MIIQWLKEDWTQINVQYNILGWTIFNERLDICYLVSFEKAMRVVAIINTKNLYTNIDTV